MSGSVVSQSEAFTAVLTTLLAHHRAGLAHQSRSDLLEFTAAVETGLAMLNALQLEAVAESDRHPVDGIVPGGADDPTRDELQAELGISTGIAHTLVDLARALRSRLPGTMRLLTAGAITVWHARRISDTTEDLSAEQCIAIEDRVLPKAPERTSQQFGASLRRAVLAVDTRTAEERRVRNEADRDVTLRRLDDQDGLTAVWALLPDTGAQTCMTAIDRIARRVPPGDTRTLAQRRADALVEICQTSLDTANTAGKPVGPAFQITLTLDALTGATDEPAHLTGTGPISAHLARQLARRDGAVFTRLILDPDDGHLLRLDPKRYRTLAELRAHDPVEEPGHSPGCQQGTGGDRYRPTPTQQKFVRTRDPVCTFPHCRRPAIADDLDHADDHAHTGTTCHCGLHPLCRHHHRAKTAGTWQIDHHPDGSITWTSPSGRGYHVPPHDHHDD